MLPETAVAQNELTYGYPLIAPLTYQVYGEDLTRVLDRAADDDGFITELTYRGSEALRSYDLTVEEKAALLSGDIGWIESRVGNLNTRQRAWLECRLQQEIW